MRPIALLTDFGTRDSYVGVMKGTIASVDAGIPVIDLTHDLPPQNLAAAWFCLLSAWEYFPPETVFVAVVDPGVGSQRRAIAIELDNKFLVGPDNGIFSGVLARSRPVAAIELTNRDAWRVANPSTTFHGRDIFAPVGARLATGMPLKELGNAIDPDTLVQFSLPEPVTSESEIVGCIQYIDRFGNCIANIPQDAIAGQNWSVEVAGTRVSSGTTYSSAATGEAIALIGSHGWLEIAVNGGSAREQLQLDWEMEMRVIFALSKGN